MAINLGWTPFPLAEAHFGDRALGSTLSDLP
jgi:hypothetical protein